LKSWSPSGAVEILHKWGRMTPPHGRTGEAATAVAAIATAGLELVI
jgi:hypothetical protein